MNTSNTNNTGLTIPKNSFWFDRNDLWLMRIVLPLVAFAVVFKTLYYIAVDWVLGNPLYFPAGVVSTLGTVNGAADAGITYGPVTADFVLTSPSIGDRLLSALPQVVFAATAVAACWWVYQIMNSVAAGRAFDRVNIRRIRGLAASVFFGGTIVPYLNALAARSLSDRFSDAGVGSVDIRIPFVGPFMWGLGATTILMIGVAFGIGSRLREDVEGTI